MELQSSHLDSRRHEYSEKPFKDYIVKLDDKEAVETSPLNKPLEGLRDFGFDEIVIYNPKLLGEDDDNKNIVMATKEFQDTEKMVDIYLGGNIRFFACIETDGTRSLGVSFGAADQKQFNTYDINEMIWAYLELIHKTISNNDDLNPLLTSG